MRVDSASESGEPEASVRPPAAWCVPPTRGENEDRQRANRRWESREDRRLRGEGNG